MADWYIEYEARWPRRRCKGCGKRLWNPRRWAHRRCVLTIRRWADLTIPKVGR